MTEINFKKSIVVDPKPHFVKKRVDLVNNRFYKPHSRRNSSSYVQNKISDDLIKKITRDNILIKEIEKFDEKIMFNIKNLESKLYIVKFQNNSLKDYYSVFL